MRLRFWIASFLFFTWLSLPGYAEPRVALVIGNSGYRTVAPLPNTNDAADVREAFLRLRFAVTTVNDGTFDDMRRALLRFGREARDAEMAVVYFAGHGMEIGGENWLIPVDAELRSDNDAENEAVSLKSVMLQVSTATNLGLVILDSCRNNPFATKIQRASRPRAVDRGLARVEPTDNVLVAYAAKDGTVAMDGRGRNSPFTASLLNNLEKPGIEIRFLLASVRDEVLAATNRQQQPFTYGSLSRQSIYFKPPIQGEAIAAAPAQSNPTPLILNEAALAWQATQNTTSVAVLEDFVRQFGATPFGSMAHARINELRKHDAANVRPPARFSPASPCEGRSITGLDSAASEPCPTSQQAAMLSLMPPPASPDPATVSLVSRAAMPLSAAEECGLTPRDTFKECDGCPEMTVLPAGTFIMGSPENEKDRAKDEGPLHRVTISKPLAVGKFHVTLEQFGAFVAETNYDAGTRCLTFEDGRFEERSHRSWRNPGFSQAASHPVVCMNWNDATAYVKLAISQNRKALPTFVRSRMGVCRTRKD
jgi:hypothetical protein